LPDSDEFDAKEALAVMAAGEDQNTANLKSIAYQMGVFYKSLRQSGVPRKLAQDMVRDFFMNTIGAATLGSLIESHDGSSDED
jgi:hypothetical protein